jgi:hypothetical protein
VTPDRATYQFLHQTMERRPFWTIRFYFRQDRTCLPVRKSLGK